MGKCVQLVAKWVLLMILVLIMLTSTATIALASPTKGMPRGSLVGCPCPKRPVCCRRPDQREIMW
ncbi:hypothetical protein Acr_00g0069840 [Actinidia rufa]|uniref:Uncharacterized protein n=1 Tax=Actinidia rufa TaxID=165716 RepID=A0A7J0DR85_9ERIC|nr:hypothetical protein Acr_00g0069840 [Actinidia rufa]